MSTNKYDIAHVDKMDGHEFEHFIATLLRKLGYQNVEVTRGSGDQGADVLAEKEGVRFAIQCKCYTADLGNTPVQEINTGKVIYHCHVGVVATNRYFTQGAKEAAKATGVLLWDRAKLQELMMQAEFMAQSISNEDALLKRGFMALEDGEWHKADNFFEQVLNLNAECGEAYLGKVLMAVQVTSLEELRGKMIRLDTFKDFSRAMQFSSGTLLQALQEVNELLQEKWRAKEEEARMIVERQTLLQVLRLILSCRKEEEAKIAKEAWKTRVSSFWKPLQERSLISAGYSIAGLKTDGSIIITDNERLKSWTNLKRKDLKSWTNIVAIVMGGLQIIGLRADGTVVPKGKNTSHWKDIVAIAAGDSHIVGLKSDGTVVADGNNSLCQCDVSHWKNIVSVAAGGSYTVGLKSDGTVVLTHQSFFNTSHWKNIVAVAVSDLHIVGLKSDGTVVTDGVNSICKQNVSRWKNIVAVAAGDFHVVGLKDDGTVMAVSENNIGECNVSNWKNIVAVAAGPFHTVGLKDDGTVVAVGKNNRSECNVSNWKLFNSIETLEQERIHAKMEREKMEREERQRQEAEKRQRQEAKERQQQEAKERQQQEVAKQRHAILEQEKSSLQTDLANLKGLFTGRRRKEIKARLVEIEREIEIYNKTNTIQK